MKEIARKILVLTAAVAITISTVLPAESVKAAQTISTQPGVTEEMLNADYWINRTPNANKVIMNPAQIAAYNQKIKSELMAAGEPMFDLNACAMEYLTDPSKKASMAKGLVAPKGDYYIHGKKIDDTFWYPIVRNMNAAGLMNTGVYLAIVVRRSNLRLYPTDQILEDSLTDNESDAMQNSGILMNEPVVIVHTSADAKWYYVISTFAKGWIHSEDVAICDSLDLWNLSQNFDDFLVVTANKVTLETDPTLPYISGIDLYMGTKLRLAPEGSYPPIISNRVVMDNYVVWIPARMPDGKLTYAHALISPSKDVSRGYLPYTTANVFRQAFKCQGDRYGWGGQANARDCSEYTMEIYKCFGIDLPRNSTTQSLIAGKEIKWDDSASASKKSSDLKKAAPGSILRFPGHIMIYLGSVNGKDYCISAASSIMSDDLSSLLYIRTVMVSTLDVKRRSGKTWLECITHAKLVRE